MKKEIIAGIASVSTYLLLPDILTNIQTVFALAGFFVAYMIFICEYEEMSRRRKRVRKAKAHKLDDYVLYEQYKDGTYHRVPVAK